MNGVEGWKHPKKARLSWVIVKLIVGRYGKPGWLKFVFDNILVHRVISRKHTVGFKRVWMRGVSEEHIRCDT